MKPSKIIYNPVIPIALTAILLVIGSWYGDASHQRQNSIDSTTSSALVARLAINGSELKIITNTYLTNTNFIFLDNKTGDVVTTLSVNNPGLEVPDYRIVKGNTHDWLVVSVLGTWGTGIKQYIDTWYALSSQGSMKMVLLYQSQWLDVPFMSNKSAYLKTEVINQNYPDDSAIDVVFTEKHCLLTDDGVEKECSESPHTMHYVWDGDNEEFAIDSKRSDMNWWSTGSL